MKEIRIGILHSLSGTMASSERPLIDAALFSIDEINKKGGILGKQLLGIVEDACSDPEIFRLKAEKLLEQNDVHVLSGCWTSSSRKAVQEVIQEKNVFLLYPVQYEGLEENPNILYSGSCLNQQISPAIDWCLSQGHKNFYLVGSDYVFPKTANALIKSLILDHGANILGEDYLPLGATDFKDVTKSIKSALPDFVINTINGDSNAGFFAHYNKSGNEFPVMSFSISENDLENLGIQSAPHYLCGSYFHNFDNEVNQRFIRDFRKYNNNPIVSDPMVMTYSQIRLWSQAVEEAGSLDIEDIQAHIHGQKLNSPAGLLEVMHNNHILKSTFIGKQTSDRKFEVIWKSDKRIKPKPWLGMEDVELPSGKLVLDALSQYPNLIHLNTELKNTKRELEKTEKELRIESGILEERVAKRTQELQESRAKYIDLYDHAPDMFASVDAKTAKILRCNQTLVSALGYNKDELIGQPIFFVYHPDCLKDAKKVFQQFVDTGVIRDAELQLKRKDGSKMDVSMNVSAVRDKKGEVLYSRSIWRDITMRKKAEEELKDIFNLSPDMVGVFTTEGELIKVNPAWEKVLGYKIEELLKLDWSKLIHPDDVEKTNKEVERQLKGGVVVNFVNRYKCKDDSYKTLEWQATFAREGIVHATARDITERKKIDESLVKLEKAVKSSGEVIFMTDIDGIFTYVNPEFTRLYGHTSIEVVGKKTPRILKGGDLSTEDYKQFWKTILGKQSIQTEYRNKTKNGKLIDIFSSVNPILDVDDKIIGFLDIQQDITERKIAEEALQESENRFQSLFESVSDGVIIIDQSGNIILWNNGAQNMFGYRREEIIGKLVTDIMPDIYRSRHLSVIQEVIKTGKGKHFGKTLEFEGLKKDGSLIPIAVTLSSWQTQGMSFFGAIIRDITERKQAEQFLKKSLLEMTVLNTLGQQVSSSLSIDNVVQSALDGIVDLMRPDMVLLFLRDKNKLFIRGEKYTNPKFRHKVTPVHKVGECLCGVAVREKRAVYSLNINHDPRCTWKECKEAGFTSFAALPMRSGDEIIGVLGIGSAIERDLSEQATFLETVSNQIAIGLQNADYYEKLQDYATKLEQEITERKQVEEKREIALQEAQNANKVKTLFLANMSHEIRTPLNTILGFAGLIEESTRHMVSEEEKKFFNVISTSGERLMHTVHEILDISQIDAGTYVMTIKDFNLVSDVQKLVDGMQIMAKEKQLKLKFHSTHKQVLIRADRDGISQSISNMIENAIKYTKKGKITIDLRQKSKSAILTIQDTGIGMSEEYLNKIFEAFSQESEGYTKKY
ncbi:MAG: transporter substrate-binding protein, partial [Candidatus Marinimicrobia bacterium]|nr:transporter substrate-binding protein [Candidatus Neomarinimicrobiota bacterium]